jgi:hypothetical protein
MRKLVWFGAILMVAAAVAVYMAADYAARHPESYLGRCAAAAVYLGAHSNPVTVTVEMVQGHGAHAAGRIGAAAICGVLGMPDCAKPEGECAVKPVPDGDNQDDVGEAAEAAEEPIEPIKPEILPEEPAPEGDENHEGGLADGQMIPFTLPVVPMQTEEPMPGTIEYNEKNFDTHENIWADRIDLLLPEKPVAGEQGDDSAEDAQDAPLDIFDVNNPEFIPAPACDEDDCEACVPADDAAEVVCEGSRRCHRGGGCWLRALMKLAGWGCEAATEAAAAVEANPEGCELLPMPTECADDEAQDEGNEEQPAEEAPSCPMPSPGCDHNHHGGCPYMGGACPYYRGTPVVTPDETPKKVRIKKKSKPAPEKDMSLEKLWRSFFDSGDDDEVQMQRWIDTLDFRPSDDPRDPPGSSPF